MWRQVAAEFHERVRSSCWDGLAGELVLLHRPHIDDAGEPVCRGCDRHGADSDAGDPVWPCRTYTIIAATLLGLSSVEETLQGMRPRRGRAPGAADGE